MQESNEQNPVTFSFKGISEQEAQILAKKGFEHLKLPHLRRIGVDINAYNVYSSPEESEPIEAESAYAAIKKTEIEDPIKLTNIHCRIEDIIENEKLEPVGLEGDLADAAEEAEEENPS